MHMRRGSSPRLAYLAGLTIVLSLSAGLNGPVFPLHAQSMGASYAAVGAMAAMGSTLHAGASMFMGRLADTAGYDFMFFLSALTISLAAAAYLVSTTKAMVGIGKALDSLFIAAYWPALESACHSAGPAAGASMGVVYTAYPIANIAASVVTGWIAARWGYRACFTAALCVGACGVLWAFRALSGPGGAGTRRRLRLQHADHQAPAGAGAERIMRHRRGGFAAAMLACFSYCLLVALAATFVPLLAQHRGMSVQIVGVLVGVFWAGRTVASYPAGVLSERLGRGAVIAPAMVMGAVGAILAFYAQSFPTLAVAVILTGVCSGAVAPVAMALGAECARPWARGWAMGLCETMCGLGFLVAGGAGGLLASVGGPGMPFLAVGIVLFGMAALLTALFRVDAAAVRSYTA
ncbi:MAG: MFS transporter [Firmicutes bacterium]|jgi:MFS family permease|nr:MFS transporter [Bacillota bacterium]